MKLTKKCKLQATRWLALLAGAAFFAPALPALAQTMELSIPGSEQLGIHDTGWGQFANRAELKQFFLDVAATFLITAAIAYHPSARAERKSVNDMTLPSLLFVYGLIGMTVGFLVVHHGYLIGFVIFGIGGLLRFRTSGESPRETMRMILVTVLGLCIGLEVPAMAVMITTVAWGVLWFTGRHEHHSVEVKFAETRHLDESTAAIRALIEENGAKVVAVNRARFKPTVEFLVSTARGNGTDAIAASLAARQGKKHGDIADWHID